LIVCANTDEFPSAIATSTESTVGKLVGRKLGRDVVGTREGLELGCLEGGVLGLDDDGNDVGCGVGKDEGKDVGNDVGSKVVG